MSKFRLNASKPMMVVGVILLLASVGFVVAIWSQIANSSLDGNARAFAVLILLFSAFVWLPVAVLGLSLVIGGGIWGARSRSQKPPCLTCGKPLDSRLTVCSSCGSASHLKKFCSGCGAPRQPHHKFCRDCGSASA